MNDDMYLSLAVQLYENGTWSESELSKKVTLYAQSKGIDMGAINNFLNRVTKKELTIDDKRRVLSVIKLDDEELKYGDVANSMSDEMVQQFYDFEYNTLGKDTMYLYYRVSKNSTLENKPQNDTKNELHVENKPQDDKKNESHVEDRPDSEIHITKKDESQSQQIFQFPNFKNLADISGPLNNSSEHEPEMPETEEEFQKQAENITDVENDSTVRNVIATPERIEKLKKNKSKVINFFLKTAIVVAVVALCGNMTSIVAIGGYLYYASEIKNGRFNPTNPVGKVVKSVVEGIMNIGLPKEEEKKEGGKAK